MANISPVFKEAR